MAWKHHDTDDEMSSRNSASEDESPHESEEEHASSSSDDGTVSDSSDEAQFPANLADEIIEKYKDKIMSSDDWMATYTQLGPLMREELVEEIVEAMLKVQRVKKNQFFRDVVEKQRLLTKILLKL